MKIEKMLKKVYNLLEKTEANGATKAEALAAAKKAQELMAKYHLDISTYSNDTNAIGEDGLDTTRKWQQILANIVAENMCCRLVLHTRNRKTIAAFFGRDSDRKIAMKTYQLFMQICTKGIRDAKQTAKKQGYSTRGIEASYSNGFIRGIREELQKTCTALVLVVPKEVNEKFAEEYKGCSQRTLRNNAGRGDVSAERRRSYDMEGYTAGKSAAGKRAIAA